MRFGFVTSVQLGLGCLEEIYKVGSRVVALFTLEDDVAVAKSGRISLDEFSELKSVPLHKLRNINDEDSLAAIRQEGLDWLFIVGWSQIVKPSVLAASRLGCIGMHPTLLPQGRGRAPIPWTILKGLDETGVTMFKLDEGVDSGPILGQVRFPVDADETAATLYEKVESAHRQLVRERLPALMEGRADSWVQDESQATYWPARRPDNGRITADMTVEQIDALVRATTRPYPGAFVEDAEGNQLTVWSGSTTPLGDRLGSELTAADGVYWIIDSEERR